MSDAISSENRAVDVSLGQPRPPIEATISGLQDLSALRQRWAAVDACPIIAETRETGLDQSWANLDVRTILRGEQTAGRFALHSIVLAPGSGLPTHYQEDVHSYVLVLDGTVEMQIGNTVETVGRHSLGYVPPLTRQSVRNASDSPVTLAVLHSPAGSDRAFAAAHEQWVKTGAEQSDAYQEVLARYGIRFDDAALDDDDKTNEMLPPVEFTFAGGEGQFEQLRELFYRRPAIPQLVRTLPEEYDTSITGMTRRKQLIKGDDTAGNAMMNLISGVPGMHADPHHQPTEEEFFFITGGTLELTCATQTKALTAGAMAFCPRNCTHGFQNKTESQVWFVTLNSPAGHERAMDLFRELSAHGADKDTLYAASAAGGIVLH